MHVGSLDHTYIYIYILIFRIPGFRDRSSWLRNINQKDVRPQGTAVIRASEKDQSVSQLLYKGVTGWGTQFRISAILFLYFHKSANRTWLFPLSARVLNKYTVRIPQKRWLIPHFRTQKSPFPLSAKPQWPPCTDQYTSIYSLLSTCIQLHLSTVAFNSHSASKHTSCN